MLIVSSVYGLLGSTNVFCGSFSSFTRQYGSTDQIQQYDQSRTQMQSGMQSVGTLATVAIVLNIGEIVTVFAVTNAGKVLGIALIILGIGTLFSMSYFGAIGFALLLSAGIAAIWYKRKDEVKIHT